MTEGRQLCDNVTGDRRQSETGGLTGSSGSSNSNSSTGLAANSNNKNTVIKKTVKVTPVTLNSDQQQGGLMLLSKMDSYSRQVAFETMKKPPPVLGNTSRLSRQNAHLFMIHKDLDKMCLREVQRHASDTKMATVNLGRIKRELLNKQRILHRQRRQILATNRQRTKYLATISEQHRQRDALHQQLDICITQKQKEDEEEDTETGLPSPLTLVSLNRHKRHVPVSTLTPVA